jgi:hypothetical protein
MAEHLDFAFNRFIGNFKFAVRPFDGPPSVARAPSCNRHAVIIPLDLPGDDRLQQEFIVFLTLFVPLQNVDSDIPVWLGGDDLHDLFSFALLDGSIFAVRCALDGVGFDQLSDDVFDFC